MKNTLLTQNGYCPDWFKRACGWASQKTLVNYDLPFLGVAPRGLVWVRKRSHVLLQRRNERQEALDEIARIPFICSGCEWTGWGDDMLRVGTYRWNESTMAHLVLGDEPNGWELSTCPSCENRCAVPDYRGLSIEKILRRWLAVDKPRLEDPRAGRFEAAYADEFHKLVSSSDMDLDWPQHDALRAWFRDINYGQDGMRANELMFMAQQMWPSLTETIAAASNRERTVGRKTSAG